MSNLIESCYESGAWYIGQFAGESAWKVIIPSAVCDWKGSGEQLPTAAKVGLLGVKILITVGATAASLAVPELCLPMMAARQLAHSQATIWLIKGVIAGSSMILNDYLTKQINGNVTPNQAEREKHVATVDKVTTFLSMGRYFLDLPLEQATCAFELLGIAAVYAYDITHQGKGFIELEPLNEELPDGDLPDEDLTDMPNSPEKFIDVTDKGDYLKDKKISPPISQIG